MNASTPRQPTANRAASRPDVYQLEIFLKVVEARSFVGAAHLLGRSQPAVSQAIARLEDIYGGDLFVRRRGQPLALTLTGEAILPSARIVVDAIDEQMTRAVATAQSRAGHLTVGLFPSLASGPLRAGLGAFRQASPEVRLRIVEGLPGDLRRDLNERNIDLMIAALLPALPGSSVEQELLWEEPLVAALPTGHALLARPSLSWADIAELPVILRESYSELVMYRTLLGGTGAEIDVQQHRVSCQTLLDMVGIGLGATIVFECTAVAHAHVAFRPIDEVNARVDVAAIYPRHDGNPLRHRLLRLIREARQVSAAG